MPAFVPTPGVLRVRCKAHYLSINCGNRFYVQYGTGAGGATAADCSAFAGAFYTAFMSRFGPYLAQDFTLDEVIVEDQTSVDAPTASHSGSTVGTGSATNPPAASVCAVVSWGLNRRYRGGKPRTYLGPLGGGIITQDGVATASAAAIAASAIAFQTDVGTMNQPTIDAPQLGTVSYETAKTPRASGLWEVFTNVRVNTRPGSQRRRFGKLQGYQV